MKKIYLLALVSLLSVTFHSCEKEPEGGNNNVTSGGKTLFNATVEALQSVNNPESKNDFWSPGEKIKIVLSDKSQIAASLHLFYCLYSYQLQLHLIDINQ